MTNKVLSENELQKIIFGACQFKHENGYLSFYRYTDQQIAYLEYNDFFHDRSQHSSAITAQFETNASKISFDYKLDIRCFQDSIDIYVNGFAHQINYTDTLSDEGTIECELPEGKKTVTVYFTVLTKTSIKNFTIDGEYQPVELSPNVLWIGDSITQGYGPVMAGMSYVNIANRYLKYNAVVQAVGGYMYDKGDIVTPIAGFTPDKIIVSLGTNNYDAQEYTDLAEGFYEKLAYLYPDKPLLSITPICRYSKKDMNDIIIGNSKIIREICSKYPNIKMVDGMYLVPHTPDMFFDGIHPNAIGSRYYAENLVREIRKLNF